MEVGAAVIELLTGLGLAMSAGLNAYIPLLALGLLGRYTSLVELPAQWAWLGNGWVLIALGVLLIVEVFADKVPALDHVNDLVQTLIRPLAGGVVFATGAAASTPGNSDPGQFFTDGSLAPFIFGLLIALGTHIAKAAGRSVVNLSTAGIGAPVVSTVEDVSATAMTIFAVLLPVLVLVFLVIAAAAGLWTWRRRSQRVSVPT